MHNAQRFNFVEGFDTFGVDGIEVGVANELIEQGIPKTDIVLAYHSPFIRQYDGFAVS